MTPSTKIAAAFATYTDEQCRTSLGNGISESLADSKPYELRAWLFDILVLGKSDTPVCNQPRDEMERGIIESLVETYAGRDLAKAHKGSTEPPSRAMLDAVCDTLNEDELTDFLDDLDTQMSEKLVSWDWN